MKMKMIICRRCRKIVEKIGTNQKYCIGCRANKEFKNEYQRNWRKRNLKTIIKQRRRWYKNNKKQVIKSSRHWGKLHPEYKSVRSHYYDFFKSRKPCYSGMPFFDGWNPDRGGSIPAGAKWIIDNIGRRPKRGKWQLHIINRKIGFMPGNLMWVPLNKHKQEEMLNRLLLENSLLKEKLKRKLNK